MGSKKIETPFHRGAEADLFLTRIDPWDAVVKKRVAKKYRNPTLDNHLRRERTLSEAVIIHEAKIAGAKVPSVLGVDMETNTIVMTRIEGTVARDCLDMMSRKIARRLFLRLGKQVARLHAGGIVHGDLTTSNIIVTPSGEPFIVDFGMSRRSVEPEDRGVDLHLLQRSIRATHGEHSILIKSLVEGYNGEAEEDASSAAWAKAREISRRGRYFAIR
jgi:TP53 regulating kinase-like protein